MFPAAMGLWRWVWLALFMAPLFVGIGDSSIWDSNEAFYVQTPREMMERGDWVVPYFNGSPRLNKPPLSYWLVGLFYKFFGVSLLAERFCMALLAAGSVLAVFWIGKLLFDPATALLGAGIFATCFRFLIMSRRLLIDVLLLLLILLAVAFLLQWLGRQNRWSWLLFAAFWALAFLAKGPVALLILLFLAPYLWITARGRLRSAPWLGAAAVFTLIVIPWFVLLGLRTGWETVLDFFFVENVGRFTHLDFGPDRGLFFFSGVLLADFFPWSILLIAAALERFAAWRREGLRGLGTNSGPAHPELLLLLWVGVWLLVFSLSHNKQEYYLLPLYPAAALLVAHYLRSRSPSRWLPVAGGTGLLLMAAVLWLLVRALFPDTSWIWLPPFFLALWIVPAVLRRWLPACALLSVFFAGAFFLYLEPLERYRPAAHFAESIRGLEAEKGDSVRVGYFRLATPSLAIYLQRPVLELYDLAEAAALLDSDEKLLLVVQPGDFAKLDLETSQTLTIRETRPRLSTSLRSLRRVIGAPKGEARDALLRPVHLIQNW